VNSDVAVRLLMSDGAVKIEILSPKNRASGTKQKTEGEKEVKQALHLPGALQTNSTKVAAFG